MQVLLKITGQIRQSLQELANFIRVEAKTINVTENVPEGNSLCHCSPAGTEQDSCVILSSPGGPERYLITYLALNEQQYRTEIYL
jgi:hypothetical protein